MIQIQGEFECKLDERGRIKLPSKLLDCLGHYRNDGFVINRGFEKNLAIYPKKVWEQKTKEINQLNIYDKIHRQAIRYFYRGATDLSLDASDRVNLPASLLQYAGIDKDVVIFAYRDFIELWSKEVYLQNLEEEPENFGMITQGLFGNNNLT